MPLNFLGWPREILTQWLEQSVPYTSSLEFNLVLAITALLIAVGALLLADRLYSPQPLASKNRDKLEADAQTRGFFRLANAKLYWDEFYGRYFEQPYNRASVWLADTLDWKLWHDGFHNHIVRDSFNRASEFLSKPVDRGAIDQGFLSIGRGIQQFSARLRRIQTGYVRTYVFTMLFGAVLVMLIILFPLIKQWLGQ
jgi:NADH:ubiquinone oxidoreductase subunit 5 (subunit L)/multisubunit Na+/H+ antiporter MnhA subunit